MKEIKKILLVILMVILSFSKSYALWTWAVCQGIYDYAPRDLGPKESFTVLKNDLLVSLVTWNPYLISEPCYLKKGTEVAVKDFGDQYCIMWSRSLGRDIVKPESFERYCWGKAPAEREGLEREEEEPVEAEGVIEQSMPELPTIIIEPIDNPAPQPTIIIEPIPGRAKFEVKKATAQQKSKPETTSGSTVKNSPTLPPPPKPKKSISKIWLLIGGLIGGMIIGVLICSFFKRKR